MHEIEIINGKAQMAYAGETPWHGLGKRVSPDLAPVEMMREAGVDWKVIKRPSFIKADGKQHPTGIYALVRKTDNMVLTNVGERWNPVQNIEAFKFFDKFIHAGDMEMHTAGSLKNGRIVWALARVRESFDLFGGDKVEPFLLFSNPHIYGKSIDIRFTPIRVVCKNTLDMSLLKDSSNGVRLNHRSSFDPEKVIEMMGLVRGQFGNYKQMAEFLGSKQITKKASLVYFNTVFPKASSTGGKVKTLNDLSPNARKSLDCMDRQPGAEYAKGSYWQAFNAVTYMTDHVMGRDNDNRLYSQWFGDNRHRKIKAMKTAMKMAEAA